MLTFCLFSAFINGGQNSEFSMANISSRRGLRRRGGALIPLCINKISIKNVRPQPPPIDALVHILHILPFLSKYYTTKILKIHWNNSWCIQPKVIYTPPKSVHIVSVIMLLLLHFSPMPSLLLFVLFISLVLKKKLYLVMKPKRSVVDQASFYVEERLVGP